jgi:hypothetical protein
MEQNVDQAWQGVNIQSLAIQSRTDRPPHLTMEQNVDQAWQGVNIQSLTIQVDYHEQLV